MSIIFFSSTLSSLNKYSSECTLCQALALGHTVLNKPEVFPGCRFLHVKFWAENLNIKQLEHVR